jgi:16S rRNA processing protein RimM
MTRDKCLLLGTISKTHGVRGELIIRITEPSFEPDENWESLFLQIDGILVPFFISSIHVPKADEWIICFEDYDTKDSVLNFIGLPVWIEKEFMAKPEEEIYLDERGRV